MHSLKAHSLLGWKQCLLVGRAQVLESEALALLPGLPDLAKSHLTFVGQCPHLQREK